MHKEISKQDSELRNLCAWPRVLPATRNTSCFSTHQRQGGHFTELKSESTAHLGRELQPSARSVAHPLTAALVTRWKHTALWSLTAVKATSITPPTCKNKFSSQTAAQTLQKLAQPTRPHNQKEKPSCFVTQCLYHPPASLLHPLPFLF